MSNLNFHMTNGEVITLHDVTLEEFSMDSVGLGLATLFYRSIKSDLDTNKYIGLKHVIKIEEIEE